MLLLFATLARADETTMIYDLFLGGKDVGDRSVTVRYLPRDDGERRVLSVFTTVVTPLGAVACRQSGQSSPRGANFTTSLRVGDDVSEVQGIEMPSGGWQLVRADAVGVHEATIPPAKVKLTTMDLFDPGRTRRLIDAGHVGLLLAETGALVEGELATGEVVSVKIGKVMLSGTRYTLQSAEGRAEFVVDAEGVLLSSELTFLGGSFRTVARTVPVPRSYGTVDVVDSPGAGTSESEI
ncbi:MAG: hypothetical protein EXR71_06940 [Myxococcales bacterium]|nr:hypothetical protein [Myxococcales bacterium]